MLYTWLLPFAKWNTLWISEYTTNHNCYVLNQIQRAALENTQHINILALNYEVQKMNQIFEQLVLAVHAYFIFSLTYFTIHFKSKSELKMLKCCLSRHRTAMQRKKKCIVTVVWFSLMESWGKHAHLPRQQHPSCIWIIDYKEL